ncbi:uncharacterized protein LTR77_002900 [Saxophila tyrrhenica]|uniref:Zn(2)-C6 fungal-type domain-containing protein n=1 Tax=Saxophila tyrrhenica TaxID=1690608 RepID=A0AAV9PGS0_9PEZI|nr:hypothetical protein LTR77_002900 [Saxophila tyrrhenica]
MQKWHNGTAKHATLDGLLVQMTATSNVDGISLSDVHAFAAQLSAAAQKERLSTAETIAVLKKHIDTIREGNATQALPNEQVGEQRTRVASSAQDAVMTDSTVTHGANAAKEIHELNLLKVEQQQRVTLLEREVQSLKAKEPGEITEPSEEIVNLLWDLKSQNKSLRGEKTALGNRVRHLEQARQPTADAEEMSELKAKVGVLKTEVQRASAKCKTFNETTNERNKLLEKVIELRADKVRLESEIHQLKSKSCNATGMTAAVSKDLRLPPTDGMVRGRGQWHEKENQQLKVNTASTFARTNAAQATRPATAFGRFGGLPVPLKASADHAMEPAVATIPPSALRALLDNRTLGSKPTVRLPKSEHSLRTGTASAVAPNDPQLRSQSVVATNAAWDQRFQALFSRAPAPSSPAALPFGSRPSVFSDPRSDQYGDVSARKRGPVEHEQESNVKRMKVEGSSGGDRVCGHCREQDLKCDGRSPCNNCFGRLRSCNYTTVWAHRGAEGSDSSSSPLRGLGGAAGSASQAHDRTTGAAQKGSGSHLPNPFLRRDSVHQNNFGDAVDQLILGEKAKTQQLTAEEARRFWPPTTFKYDRS